MSSWVSLFSVTASVPELGLSEVVCESLPRLAPPSVDQACPMRPCLRRLSSYKQLPGYVITYWGLNDSQRRVVIDRHELPSLALLSGFFQVNFPAATCFLHTSTGPGWCRWLAARACF
jgi:hypothetical protein